MKGCDLVRARSRDTLRVELDWKLHTKQRRVLMWRPERPEDGSIPLSVIAVLGGLGSGKTTVAVKASALHCFRNGWHEGYGEDEPKFVVMRPTLRGLTDDLIPRYRREIPSELIRRRWKSPFPRWELHNGVHIIFMSGDSDAWSGWDLIGFHIDEIDLPIFDDPARFTDMMMRLRDPNAAELLMMVSGKASLGFVRETFKVDELPIEDRFNRETFLFGTDDNPFLPAEARRQALKGTPSHYQKALLKGGWLPASGSLFPMFEEEVHMVPDARADAHAPCHVGIDAGITSAAVIGQELTVKLRDGTSDKGALIVGDVLRHGASLKDLCLAVRATKWNNRLYPTKSKILADPTISQEELDAIRGVFRGFHVICRERSDDLYDNMAGLRTMQAGLRNAADDVHVFVCQSVKKTGKTGFYDGLLKCQENKSGSVSTTYKFHSIAAGKYLLSWMLSTPKPPPKAHKRK